MAQVDKATFITQIDAAAAALTIAMSDTLLTEVAGPLKRPQTPLRKVERLFILDLKTGEYKTDTDYIDAAYEGKFPKKGTSGVNAIAD